jgi:hypothetical protein
LRTQLLEKLMQGNSELMDHGALNRDLLRELPERQDDVLRGILDRWMVLHGALEVRICRKRTLSELEGWRELGLRSCELRILLLHWEISIRGLDEGAWRDSLWRYVLATTHHRVGPTFQ